MMNNLIRKCNKFFFVSLFFFSSITASHNTNRYFQFLERPESYTDQHPYSLTTDIFYISASNGFKREGGSTSLLGLWGDYDLNEVINSAQVVNGASFENPILTTNNLRPLANSQVLFQTPGKIRSQGISFRAQAQLPFCPSFSIGFWFPIMHVSTRSSYCFNSACLDPSNEVNPTEKETDLIDTSDLALQLDTIRRKVHNSIDIKENFWSYTSVGDVDVYLRWQHIMDHKLRMRSIAWTLQAGILIPTGAKANIDYPSSVSFMGDGHWALYFDFVPEFELKQDVKLGLFLGAMVPFSKEHTRRIAINKEPHIFSALKGQVSIKPGVTIKVSPYLMLENIADGLSIQARYTYLRHSTDHWRDRRTDRSLATSLVNCQALQVHERLSSWRGHFLTFQLTYNTRMALNNFNFDPILYLAYDFPAAQGAGISKMNQVTFGLQLQF